MSINNVKRFFKDDAGDYKPVGCVAATLNNSVLHNTHKSCDGTVKYFVCKQSEYLLDMLTKRRIKSKPKLDKTNTHMKMLCLGYFYIIWHILYFNCS
jgi:hypothetical protein